MTIIDERSQLGVLEAGATWGRQREIDILRFEPYYAEDTDGVHFLVKVDGVDIWAHIGGGLLQSSYGRTSRTEDYLRVFARHRAEIESAVACRVRQDGPEAVILRSGDLTGMAGFKQSG